MGANATTFVPSYTSGEVLTAANLSVTNSGIPVFANSTARTAAFGGTGEKVLAEGQFSYLEDTNVTSFWDGAAWQPVGTTPGLVCVKAETAFTTASSVTADAVFTSSYSNYRLIIDAVMSGNNTQTMAMKFRIAGTSTSTLYSYAEATWGGSSWAGSQVGNGSSYLLAQGGSGPRTCVTADIIAPQLARTTMVLNEGQWANNTDNNPYRKTAAGNQGSSSQFDGIELLTSSGTMTGTYAIYGYSKTV
jgi:hypothetical protein